MHVLSIIGHLNIYALNTSSALVATVEGMAVRSASAFPRPTSNTRSLVPYCTTVYRCMIGLKKNFRLIATFRAPPNL